MILRNVFNGNIYSLKFKSLIPPIIKLSQKKKKRKRKLPLKHVLGRDGNFVPPLLALPCTGFSHSTKVAEWGWSKILVLHHEAGQGGDEFRHFRPALPLPIPTLCRVVKSYNCKFSYPKTLLFKKTYQY